MTNRHHWLLWILPAAILAVGVLPMPYGYYQLLRWVVCGAASYLAYTEWADRQTITPWAVALAALAILLNPIVPVHLSKGVWRWLDGAGAVLFVTHWLRRKD